MQIKCNEYFFTKKDKLKYTGRHLAVIFGCVNLILAGYDKGDK